MEEGEDFKVLLKPDIEVLSEENNSITYLSHGSRESLARHLTKTLTDSFAKDKDEQRRWRYLQHISGDYPELLEDATIKWFEKTPKIQSQGSTDKDEVVLGDLGLNDEINADSVNDHLDTVLKDHLYTVDGGELRPDKETALKSALTTLSDQTKIQVSASDTLSWLEKSREQVKVFEGFQSHVHEYFFRYAQDLTNLSMGVSISINSAVEQQDETEYRLKLNLPGSDHPEAVVTYSAQRGGSDMERPDTPSISEAEVSDGGVSEDGVSDGGLRSDESEWS